MMRSRTSARRVLAAAASAAVSLLGLAAAASADVTVESAWIAEMPPGATTAAGFANFVNTGAEDVAIVAADSACCERIEFHEMQMADGVARMRPRPALEIPAGESLSLAATGTHLMLIRPQPLQAGERVTIRFASESGQELAVEFEVRARKRDAAGAAPPGGAHHHHHAQE